MLLIVLITTAARPRRLWLFVSFFFHLHPFVMRLTYSRNHPGRSCTSSAAVGCQSCREGQARRAQGSQGQWHRSASWRWWWKLWYQTVLSSFFSCLHLGLFFFLVFFAVSPDQTSGEESCLGPEREQGPPKNSGPPFSTTFPRTTSSQVKITLHSVVLTKEWEVETGPFHALVLLEDPEVEPSILITPALHEEEGCRTLVPVLNEGDVGLYIALLLHGMIPWSTLLPNKANLGLNLTPLLPDKTPVHLAPPNLS